MKATVLLSAIAMRLLISANAIQAELIHFDAATEFSSTVNSETSMWSYRYKVGTARDGNYPLMPSYGPANGTWSPSNPGAWSRSGSGLPYLGVNRTGTTVSNSTSTPGDNFSLTNGTFFMRPAANSLVVLSWLSPFEIPYRLRIVYSFADIDEHGGNGVILYHEVRHADGSANAQGYGGGLDGVAGSGQFRGTIEPGDRFNLMLSTASMIGSDTDERFDAIRLTLTIVPEPSAISLIVMGSCIGLCVARRRVRN
jgi:hypothetical protein